MFEGEKIFEGVLPRTKYDSKWLKELMKELKEIKIDKKSAKDKALIVFIYLKLRELRKITKEIKKSMELLIALCRYEDGGNYKKLIDLTRNVALITDQIIYYFESPEIDIAKNLTSVNWSSNSKEAKKEIRKKEKGEEEVIERLKTWLKEINEISEPYKKEEEIEQLKENVLQMLNQFNKIETINKRTGDLVGAMK